MEKDSFGFGVLVCIILPIIGFVIWWGINYSLRLAEVMDRFGNIFQFSEKTIVLTSLCLNLIPFHYAKNNKLDTLLRAVGVVTVLMLLFWAYYYGVFKIF